MAKAKGTEDPLTHFSPYLALGDVEQGLAELVCLSSPNPWPSYSFMSSPGPFLSLLLSLGLSSLF